MANPSGDPKGGSMRPFYQMAMREVVERGDTEQIQLLLDEARIIKQRFGSVDGAIADLEAALKRHG